MCPSVEHSSYTSIRRTRDSQEMLLWREKEEVEITTRETKLTPQMTTSRARGMPATCTLWWGFILLVFDHPFILA